MKKITNFKQNLLWENEVFPKNSQNDSLTSGVESTATKLDYNFFCNGSSTWSEHNMTGGAYAPRELPWGNKVIANILGDEIYTQTLKQLRSHRNKLKLIGTTGYHQQQIEQEKVQIDKYIKFMVKNKKD